MTQAFQDPSAETGGRRERHERRSLVAWFLIGFGILLLANNQLHLSGGIFLIALGAAFLVAYASTRSYGLLIVGMVLASIGLGNVTEDLRPFAVGGDWTTFWLGAGFIGIYLTDRFTWRQSGTWPLWPGSLLVLFGLWDIAEDLGIIGFLWQDVIEEWWPLALILIGAYLLRPRSGRAEADVPPPG